SLATTVPRVCSVRWTAPAPSTRSSPRSRGFRKMETEDFRARLARGNAVVLRSIFQRGPELKSPRELGLMREAGKIVAEALRTCREVSHPGVRTVEIDQAVEGVFRRYGATPLFKGYPGAKVPFPAATCI